MNSVILIGRLTAEAELKYTQSKLPVTSFCLAVERRYTKDGERQADFINCVAWRNTAEFISKYFAKGDPIAIQGELQTRKYIDRKTGESRTAVEVEVNDARFVPAKSNNTNDSTPPAFSNSNNDDFSEISGDDDLPF